MSVYDYSAKFVVLSELGKSVHTYPSREELIKAQLRAYCQESYFSDDTRRDFLFCIRQICAANMSRKALGR